MLAARGRPSGMSLRGAVMSNESMIMFCAWAMLTYILWRCAFPPPIHAWVYGPRNPYRRECVKCGRREEACYVWHYQQKVHFWDVIDDGDPSKHGKGK